MGIPWSGRGGVLDGTHSHNKDIMLCHTLSPRDKLGDTESSSSSSSGTIYAVLFMMLSITTFLCTVESGEFDQSMSATEFGLIVFQCTVLTCSPNDPECILLVQSVTGKISQQDDSRRIHKCVYTRGDSIYCSLLWKI